MAPRRAFPYRRRRRDLGLIVARLLAAVFALVGALPLGLALLVRAPLVREWASRETSLLLHRELGLDARFDVDVRLFPLAVEVRELTVEASDGLGPALQVERIAVKPRLFSLLAGKFDAGDVEVDSPRLRLIVKDGELQNVAYRLPALPESEEPVKAPFSSIAITDARLELDIEGYRVHGEEIDLDVGVFGESFELALRAGEQRIVRERPLLSIDPADEGRRAADEDRLCRLDARVRVDPGGILVRTLDLFGAVDLDPAADTDAGCALDEDDVRRLELRLSHVQVKLPGESPLEVEGRVKARVPVALTHRFVSFVPVKGWVGLDIEGRYDERFTLPELRGQLWGGDLALERYELARTLKASIELGEDKIRSETLELGFADGTIRLGQVEVDPFATGGKMRVGSLDASDVTFPGLMRDLGVTEKTVVAWDIDEVHASNIEGRFDPLKIDGDLRGKTKAFAVFDRSFDDPERQRMVGVREASLRGRFNVRPDALIFSGMRVDFGSSRIDTTVSIGFNNRLFLEVTEPSRIELSDISPLGTLDIGGRASLSAKMDGPFDDPILVGDVSVSGLQLAGFPFGDVTSAKALFRPLFVEFSEVHGQKGQTRFSSKHARLDFGSTSALLAEADVEAGALDLHDFFHMWHFDADPRFADLSGRGRAYAKIRYDLKGPADLCRGGLLDIRGGVHLDSADLFDEHYDEAAADFHYVWLDPEASDLGLHVDIPSLSLRKGRGRIFGAATIRPGGLLRATVQADEIPLSKLQGLGPMGAFLRGHASAIARVSGTLDEMEADVDVRIGRVEVGRATLPESKLRVLLESTPRERRAIGRTFCGRPIHPPFDRVEYERDRAQGVFRATGRLFGEQIAFDDFRITRQRKKVASGSVVMQKLDLGALASVAAARGEEPLVGVLSGRLDIGALSFDALDMASATLRLSELSVGSKTTRLALRRGSPPITIAQNRLFFPEIALDATSTTGFSASLLASGEVKQLSQAPDLDLEVRVPSADLSALSSLLPRVERASGKASAIVKLSGAPEAPLVMGEAHLEDGELSIRGLPALFSEVNADVVLGGGEIRLVRAQAQVGGGTLSMTGNAPLHGFDLGDATASILANGVHLPMMPGMQLALDAELLATIAAPRGTEEERPLPRVTGDVTLTSFSYTRPISVVEDIGAIAQRARRKLFEAYDPLEDAVSFDLRLRTREPLRLRNNLVDAQLVLDSESLALAGTNQRFGMRGQLRVLPSGRVRLRANEFEVRQGWIRFDDATRIAPNVDITAVTEYRRYSSSSETQGMGSVSGDSGASAMSHAGGSWRITLHAHGDADDLRLDMTSDPPLAQEDIALLLYMGMTRAELDQLQASSIGETAALEALSALSGADTVVKQVVPVIDDFRLGSAYSSRTGRTEPTITVGKRVTEDVRASVTSGLSDNREVRSNLEWRLSPKVSVQGSYDNVNDVSSSSLGNLGVDVRYRIELE